MRRALASILLISLIIITSCSLAIEPRDEDDVALSRPLATPGGLSGTVTSRSASGATVSLEWDVVEGASAYIIYYQTAVDRMRGEDPSTSVSSTASSSLVLDSDEVYLFQVASLSGDGRGSEASGLLALSTLSTIEDVTVSINSNQVSFIIRHASASFEGEALETPVFSFTLREADGGDAYYSDGSLASEADPVVLRGSSYSFPKPLAPASDYVLSISMEIGDEVIDTYELSFSSDLVYEPGAVSDLEASSGDASSIKVTFKAPPINEGLDEGDIQRRFRITRHSLGEDDYTVLPETLPPEGEGDVFTFTDSDPALAPNTAYWYSVTSYYLFSDSAVYYAQSAAPVETGEAHLFSVPVDVDASLSLSKAHDETDDGHQEYEAVVSFRFPFGLAPDDTVALEQRERSFSSNSSDWTPVDDFSLEADGEVVTLSYSFQQDAEASRDEHSWSYRVTVTSAGGASSSEVSNIVTTTASEVHVDLVTGFTATQDLAGRIILSWTASDGTSLRLLRSTSADFQDSEELSISTPGAHVDTGIVDGEGYHYALIAEADGHREAHYVEASSLPAVSGLVASQGRYADRISLSWEPVVNVTSYEVHVSADPASLDDADSSSIEWRGPVATVEGSSFDWVDEDVGTSRAGRPWLFTVKPVDRTGQVSSHTRSIAEGSLLGPATIVVEASDATYAEEIRVSWNEVPGAGQYIVRAYASQDAIDPVLEERINAQDGCSFILRSDDERLREASITEPLSRSYWFSIIPQYNDQVSETGTDRVEGRWITPPSSITATKAASSEITRISWEPVEGATLYNVYRRVLGSSDDWTFVGSSSQDYLEVIDRGSGDRAVNDYYEYTVSTSIGRAEGPVQDDFDGEGGDAANVGFPLYHPESVRIIDVDHEGTPWYLVSFYDNSYATGYQVSSPLRPEALVVDRTSLQSSPIDIADAVDGSAWIEDGLVSIYMQRPHVRDSVYIDISISSINDDAIFETDKVSQPTTQTRRPDSLLPIEELNLAESAMRQAFRTADGLVGGDWWTMNGGRYTFTSGTAVTASGAGGSDASLELDAYTYSGIVVSGTLYFPFRYYVGGDGYLWEDNVDRINTAADAPMTIRLPLDYGTVQVHFNDLDYRSDGTPGSYTVVDSSGSHTIQQGESEVGIL